MLGGRQGVSSSSGRVFQVHFTGIVEALQPTYFRNSFDSHGISYTEVLGVIVYINVDIFKDRKTSFYPFNNASS